MRPLPRSVSKKYASKRRLCSTVTEEPRIAFLEKACLCYVRHVEGVSVYQRISAFLLGICEKCGEPIVIPDERNFKDVFERTKCGCGAVITHRSLGMRSVSAGYIKERWVYPDGADVMKPVWKSEEPRSGFRLRSWWVAPRFLVRNYKPVFPRYIRVVCQKWSLKLGGVSYPAGFSLHRTMRERDQYAKEYAVASEGTFEPHGESFFCLVDNDTFRKIDPHIHGYYSDAESEECPPPLPHDGRERESKIFQLSA